MSVIIIKICLHKKIRAHSSHYTRSFPFALLKRSIFQGFHLSRRATKFFHLNLKLGFESKLKPAKSRFDSAIPTPPRETRTAGIFRSILFQILDIPPLCPLPSPSVGNNANKQHGFQLLGRTMRRGRGRLKVYRASRWCTEYNPNRKNRKPARTRVISNPCRLVSVVSSRVMMYRENRPVPVHFLLSFSERR